MKKTTLILALIGFSFLLKAQTFEAPQIDTIPFTKVKTFIGADFALQFQALSNRADSVALIPLGKGFNLPTANLTVGAHLAPGIKVVLETYLSSRHHNETWVKGGYLLLDKLPFIKSDLVDNAMKHLTLKVGVMELNYGDANFRRSDNGRVINNAFVGNYIMNAFTTGPTAELYFRKNGILAVGGVSQVIVNQVLVGYNKNTSKFDTYNTADELSFYGKVGLDKQINDDLRIRGTVSGFSGKNHSLSLYSGDRAGSRYYLVMNQQKDSLGSATDIKSGHLASDYHPGAFGTVIKANSVMLNLYTEFKGLRVFGIYEIAKGTNSKWNAKTKVYDENKYDFTQLSIEGLYYFGKDKQFYIGSRFNSVTDQLDQKVSRIHGIAGWEITKNILAKIEYVNQTYTDFTAYKKADAGFNGIIFETTISF